MEMMLRKVFLKVCERIERREQDMKGKVTYFGTFVH